MGVRGTAGKRGLRLRSRFRDIALPALEAKVKRGEMIEGKLVEAAQL